MIEAPTIAKVLRLATDKLRAADISEAQLTAQSLLAAALGQDRTYLIVNFKRQLTSNEIARFEKLLSRRVVGEPLQYIIGHQEFFGLEFEVTPDVLIPRPETELIVEEILRLAEGVDASASPVIIDIGTGSGCLAVTFAREIPNARVIASDISLAALSVALRNARRHSLNDRIAFLNADLITAFVEAPIADFIVSNPPYIAAEELPQLQREVRDWEPQVALTDFFDGLSVYRRLFREAPARLRSNGHLLCEIGYSQSDAVVQLIDEKHWNEPRLLSDLQGIPRVIVLQKR